MARKPSIDPQTPAKASGQKRVSRKIPVNDQTILAIGRLAVSVFRFFLPGK